FRVLVSYKNLQKLFIKVIALNDSVENKEELYYQEKNINLYNIQPIVKSWYLDLPDNSDYQNHKTEIIIPALTVGKYLIMAGTDSSFTYIKNGIAYCKTWVTNLSFFNRRLNDQSVEILTLHRKSGAILSEVDVEVFYNTYVPDLRKYKYIKVDSGKTDSDGIFKSDLYKYPYSTYKIVFHKGEDGFESDENH
ncbi:MAG TPA: hypothetical protein PKE38_11375, partial [Ignavibacteriaceae bacterium]|nr:hypothetical protein [Ignavibacteriaceae bacterium]